MPLGGAYSGGLFDSQGPFKFAEAVGTIPAELNKIVDAFTAIDAKASQTLQDIQARLKDIVSLTGQMGIVGGSTGGAGGRWTGGGGQPANGGTGGQRGNQMGVGGTGNEPATFVPQTVAPNGGNQGGLAGAAQAAGAGFAALGGVAQRNLSGRQGDITAEDLYANLAARSQPGGWTRANQRMFSSIPKGQLAQSGADFATAQAAAQMGLGVMPLGSAGLGNVAGSNQAGANQFLNAGQWLAPGASRTDLAQGLSTMYSGRSMNAALGTLGINMQQGGQQMNPQAVFDAIVNRAINGGFDALAKLPAGTVEEALRPGYALYQTATIIFGGDQNMWQSFYNYVITKVNNLNSSNPATRNANPFTAQGAKQSGLQTTIQQSALAKTSAQAQAQSQLTAGTASAQETLNKAATTFYNAVDNFVKGTGTGGLFGQAQALLGGVGGPLGGILGGLGGLFGFGGGGGAGGGGGGGAAGGLGGLVGAGASAYGISKILGALKGAGGAGSGSTGASAADAISGAIPATATDITGAAGAAGGIGAAGAAGVAGVFGASVVAAGAANKGTASLYESLGLGNPYKGGSTTWGDLFNPPALPIAKRAWKSAKGFFNSLFNTSASADPSNGTSGTSTTAATGSSVPSNITAKTPTDFASDLLQAIGAPQSSQNIASLVNWENREGGNWHNTAYYNPLNTTKTMPGSKSMNSVGVQSYTSWSQGLEATVETLNSGYGDIMAALQQGGGLGSGHYAGLARWSGGGYDHLARGSYDIATTQLALLHKGERVVPAAENYSNTGRYTRAAQSGAAALYLNFQPGSIVLGQGATPDDATQLVKSMIKELDKNQLLSRIATG